MADEYTREWKFRAWDPAEKKMYSPEQLEEPDADENAPKTIYGKIVDGDLKIMDMKHNPPVEFLPMQCTNWYDNEQYEVYEGDILDIDESVSCSGKKNSKDNLSKFLASKDGVTLFIIELHDVLPANYQPNNENRFKDNQNMCGILTGGGFWAQALKDAGFGAIANILIDRQNNNYQNQKNKGYTAYKVKINNQDWWRTFPTKPLFISKAMNGDPNAAISGVGGQNRYKFKIKWTKENEKSHSLEVFIQSAQGSNEGKPFTTRLGTCFSTEQALCN